jgi:hypothetical protein
MVTSEQRPPAIDSEPGPIDWIIIEWEGERPRGEDVAPIIIDLVDRGVIRLLDIAFIAKADDGSVEALDLDHLGPSSPFAVFSGASTGLVDHEDLIDAGEALAPGTSAAILLWENSWAAPVAAAVRRSGGQLIASGRVDVEALLESLDTLEAAL